jgi:hypothetical protein
MKRNFNLLAISLFALVYALSSYSKDSSITPGEYGIKFLEQYNDNEIPAVTTYVASDLYYHYRALIAPAGNIASAKYSVFFDALEAVYYDYTVNAGNDQGFLLDLISYDFNYKTLAGVVNVVTLAAGTQITILPIFSQL